MSLFKGRSGGSLFRIKALEGYIKYLNTITTNGSQEEDTENLITNKMSFKFLVKDNETLINRMSLKYSTRDKE